MTIEKCLTLSTAHMPDTAPDFGDHRSCTHEYGCIVFLTGDYHVDESLCLFVEPWFREIYKHAVDKGCTYIVFDCDEPVVEGFKTYEW